MSWWIGVEIDTGGDEPLSCADRNVTYNVSGMFHRALDIPEPGVHTDRCLCVDGRHETGLQALHGAPAVEAAGVIHQAIDRMNADPEPYRAMNPPNGWGSYESALEDLRWLLDQCLRHPKGQVYVH